MTTMEEAQDQLLQELGVGIVGTTSSGPLLVGEDIDNDSYYVRVESVTVSEVAEQGGATDGTPNGIRVATLSMSIIPTTGPQ